MSKYSFALSDELCEQYYRFKQYQYYDKDRVSRLLSYYNGEYITNTSQLDRIGITVSKTLTESLRHSGLSTQTIEELAAKTTYKLILCTDRSTFPYVNIVDNDPICNCVIGGFHRGVARDKAISHIHALCKGGSRIYLYDTYLSCHRDVLKLILPDKSIELIYAAKQLSADDVACLSSYNPKWKLTPHDAMLTHHDRYIIIDDKLEIILTSGFEYLNSYVKEISYIVRPILANRLIRK